MAKLRLLVIGPTKFSFAKEMEAEYLKRIQKFVKLSVEVIPVLKGGDKMPPAEVKRKEADLVRKKVKGSRFILLDENGKTFQSTPFANWLEDQLRLHHELVFVVGGAYGFDSELKKEAQGLISMSAMTFSHQIIRGFFLEQVYRAFTIINGHPYHND